MKTGSSLASNKQNFDFMERSSAPGSFKRSFDSIGHFSDMEDAVKRSDLGVNSKFDLIERASYLSRMKKAIDSSTEHKTDMDVKRGFDSIDHFSDMAAVKRRSLDRTRI